MAGCPSSDSEREVLGPRRRPRTMGNPGHGRLPFLHMTCFNKHLPSSATTPFLSKSFLSIQDAQGNFAEASQRGWERRLYLTLTPMSSAPVLAPSTLCLSAASWEVSTASSFQGVTTVSEFLPPPPPLLPTILLRGQIGSKLWGLGSSCPRDPALIMKTLQARDAGLH